MAILPPFCPPLPPELKRQIFQQFCRGDSAEALAQRFCRSCTRIYGIIKEVRALRIMDLPLDSVGDEQFARLRSAKADREILPPPPESEPPAKKLRVPGGTPAYLASLYGVPLLTREQEAHLFWKMNYLKHKARGLRDELDVERPKSCLMRRIEKLYDESLAIKNRLIRSNLRLVVSIAKRYIGAATDFSDLVSDGNMSLIRAVQKFDVSQGNRFSTYASWAIMKNYARTVSDVLRQRSRFCTNHSAEFSFVEDDRTDPHEREAAQRERESLVGRILNRLDERERQIVTSRFGLIRGQEPLTLKEVGAVLGVSKERIRQIQGKALNKLRLAAGEENIE